ncbi:MAG TPA: hypothetical protein VNZ26_07970, partial [Vicinamibacterales bacterium]|nr:hypothetical protein [Vicinamibacterales bacterium]
RVGLHGVRIFGGGTVTIAGADEEHAVDTRLDGVMFDSVAPTVHASHARVRFGPRPVNLSIAGPDVRVSAAGIDVQVTQAQDSNPAGDLLSCEGRFVEFRGTR